MILFVCVFVCVCVLFVNFSLNRQRTAVIDMLIRLCLWEVFVCLFCISMMSNQSMICVSTQVIRKKEENNEREKKMRYWTGKNWKIKKNNILFKAKIEHSKPNETKETKINQQSLVPQNYHSTKLKWRKKIKKIKLKTIKVTKLILKSYHPTDHRESGRFQLFRFSMKKSMNLSTK